MINRELNYSCVDRNTWNHLTERKQMCSGSFNNVIY